MAKKERRLSVPLVLALAAVCAIFAFRVLGGTSVNAAPAQASPSGRPPDFVFYEPVTVESLREQVTPLGQDVVVTEPDGTQRKSGRLVTGDVIEIVDKSGKVLDSYTAVVMGGESSSAPQSSSPPADSQTPSEPESSVPAGSSVPPEEPESSVPAGSSVPPEEPESSIPAGSSTPPEEPVSSLPAGSSVPPEEPVSSAPADDGFSGDGDYYLFPGSVTVEELAAQISTQPHGLRLEVTAPSGKKRASGAVCTGDTVETLDADGTRESSVTAVIPGDLMGDGGVTDAGLALLRDCLLNRETLRGIESRAADMDRDGVIDTSDLLLMEKSRRTE